MAVAGPDSGGPDNSARKQSHTSTGGMSAAPTSTARAGGPRDGTHAPTGGPTTTDSTGSSTPGTTPTIAGTPEIHSSTTTGGPRLTPTPTARATPMTTNTTRPKGSPRGREGPEVSTLTGGTLTSTRALHRSRTTTRTKPSASTRASPHSQGEVRNTHLVGVVEGIVVRHNLRSQAVTSVINMARVC